MMTRWWICSILFVFLQFLGRNCDDHLCHYLVTKSDNRTSICIGNECDQFVDLYSIMVKPNDCKTKELYLAFSSYKKFHLFLNRIGWKLSDLFPSRLNNQIRLLRIYLHQIDLDDQPADHQQLIHLGTNIDLYQLYIEHLPQTHYLSQSIHYDFNDPRWNIIQIQFDCSSLMRVDEDSCSRKILPPPFFAPRRPSLTTKILPLSSTIQFSSSRSSTTEQTKKENTQSIHFILIISIPFGFLFFTLIIAIIVYRSFILKRSASITSRSSSIPSISNQSNCFRLYSTCQANAQPYQVSRIPSPHLDSLYKETERNF